jgi:hypothetical protein
MAAPLLFVLALAQGVQTTSPPRPEFDSVAYRDAATAALITRAAARHSEQLSRLKRYAARVRTRMEASVGTSRFGPGLRIINVDLVARVRWQRPMDVSVELLGARSRVARLPGADRETLGNWMLQIVTAEPWFAPGAMGDEIDFMGIPHDAALHPLAPGAEPAYRYAIVDSVAVVLPTRKIRTLAVSVEPRRYDQSLVQGTIWLDADSLDVARLSVAFVGPGLWEEGDHDSPRLVAAEADLEYGLHEGRYWLPLRQILTLDWRYRYLPGASMPARAVSTFDGYQLEQVPPIVFQPDTDGPHFDQDCDPWSSRTGVRCGDRREIRRSRDHDGYRYQIVMPPHDSLARFDFQESADGSVTFDDEEVGRRLTELARQAGTLPAAAAAQRRPPLHPVLAALIRDGVRFNRVQGPSLGGGLRLGFTPLIGLEPSLRVSAGDERLTGALAVRRDGPDLEAWVRGHHRLREVEPWTSGLSLAGTLRAALLGDDAADYYLGTGAEIGAEWRLGPLRGTRMVMGWERQRSVATTDGSVVHDVMFGDGGFPLNPSIVEGNFGRVNLSHRRATDGGTTVALGLDALAGGDRAAGRAWATADVQVAVGERRVRLAGRAGHVLGDSLPQLDFRAGGRHTVRGYEYGARRGRGLWAVQGEIEVYPNEWVAPVLMLDVGNVIGPEAGDPLVGAGVGLSVGNGWLVIDLVKGLNPGTVVRADLSLRVPVW